MNSDQERPEDRYSNQERVEHLRQKAASTTTQQRVDCVPKLEISATLSPTLTYHPSISVSFEVILRATQDQSGGRCREGSPTHHRRQGRVEDLRAFGVPHRRRE